MIQARQACEAWKKEAAMAKQKADMAIKEKDAALTKLNALQKEVSSIISCLRNGKNYVVTDEFL